MTPDRPDWMDHANCKGVDTNLFFPERNQPVSIRAKAICAACTVREQCAEAAIADTCTVGLWGGLTERQRRAIRSGRPSTRRPIRHGTHGGYMTHRRRGEQPCDACRTAHADECRENDRARRLRGIA